MAAAATALAENTKCTQFSRCLHQTSRDIPASVKHGGGIHRPDNGDPTHGITATNCGVYLLVLGLSYGRADYKCAQLHRNYAIVICIRIPAFCKNLDLLVNKNLGLGRTESDARRRTEVEFFFEELDEAANIADIRTIKSSHLFLLWFFSRNLPLSVF